MKKFLSKTVSYQVINEKSDKLNDIKMKIFSVVKQRSIFKRLKDEQ